jgi:hypothetical protein
MKVNVQIAGLAILYEALRRNKKWKSYAGILERW